MKKLIILALILVSCSQSELPTPIGNYDQIDIYLSRPFTVQTDGIIQRNEDKTKVVLNPSYVRIKTDSSFTGVYIKLLNGVGIDTVRIEGNNGLIIR